MAPILDPSASEGLERSCTSRLAPLGERPASSASRVRGGGDWLRSRGPVGGVELLQAWFAGRGGFSVHRHDTYGICVTDLGLQEFGYRGSIERSLPGQVTVLHPDEKHDGRSGTDSGFGYHIVYVEPAQIGAAARAITGRPTPLPFAREPVGNRPPLARVVTDAFRSGLEPLARDSLIVQLAEGLLAADPSLTAVDSRWRLDLPALSRARDFLHARRTVVRSAELEAVTGLSRFELARQFRMLYGTSPYRYSLQRRLDWGRLALRRGEALADVALGAGFADQAHFTRMFAATFGMPPGRYALLSRSANAS